MAKETTYIQLYMAMKDLEFFDPLSTDFLNKGNLAYFVDTYFDSENWGTMYDQIMQYIKIPDVCELCFYLCKYIYDAAIVSNQDAFSKAIYEASIATVENAHTKKHLKSFCIVGKELFPDWFKMVNYILS